MSTSGTNRHTSQFCFPPLGHLLALAAGLALHFRCRRLPLFPQGWIGQALGWPLAGAGGLLMLWGVKTMRRAGEDPASDKPTAAIISTGPFAFSRNPLYVALNLAYLGITLIVNTVWPLPLVAPAIAFVHCVVIPREERYLEASFGDEYRAYQRRVPRWC